MNNFLKDLKHAGRALLRKPGFTVVAVITLALAIGAASAMFSVVNAVLLRPLNFEDSENVLIVWESKPDVGFDIFSTSPANFFDWHRLNKSFESIAAYTRSTFTLTGIDQAERIPGAFVTGDYFKLLRAQPAIGRTLNAEDAVTGKQFVVVLSHGLWTRRFGSDPAVVGRALTLDGRPYTVAGVMPQDFMYPTNTEMWAPQVVNATDTRGGHFLTTIGRLNSGATIDSATAEMKTIASQLEKQFPETNTGWTVRLFNLQEYLVGDIRQALLILLGAVGFVLLIACVNVANLQLARGSDRSKEIAVRTALGASRFRVVRQLLTESVILSLLGGVLGTVLAAVLLNAFLAVAPANIPRLNETTIDKSVLAFSAGISLLTGIIFGLFPALHSIRSNLNDSLKENSKGSSSGIERNRVRQGLVVAEIGFTLIVVIGAGLMLKSLQRLQSVNPGFDPENVLTLRLNLPRARYGEEAQQRAFTRNLIERVEALPGVTAAAVTSVLPLSGQNFIITFDVGGKPIAEPGKETSAHMRFVTPEYFQTMKMPIVRGRPFNDQDTATSQPVVMISESMARRYFPGEDPVGQTIRPGYGTGDADPPYREIVGVVGDIKHTNLKAAAQPEYYVPMDQLAYPNMTLVVKTAVEPASLTQPLRSEVSAIDPNLAVYGVLTMREVLGTSISDTRLNAALLAAFGLTALLLASIGVYGVIAYSVTNRTQEIGIRMALGANRSSVLSMVVKQGLMLVAIGVGIGVIGALFLTRFMQTMVFEVSLTDPPTFIAVSLLLILVAVLASYIPARRATRVDPMIALRYE